MEEFLHFISAKQIPRKLSFLLIQTIIAIEYRVKQILSRERLHFLSSLQEITLHLGIIGNLSIAADLIQFICT